MLRKSSLSNNSSFSKQPLHFAGSSRRRRGPRAKRQKSFMRAVLLTISAVFVLWIGLLVYFVGRVGPSSSSSQSSSWWHGFGSSSSGGGGASDNVPKPDLPEPSDEMIDMRRLNAELPFDNPDGGAWKQGWDVQPDDKPHLTILVVPHSHCDPGWIKTFDEYFQQQTKSIISTVINALLEDPRRTFIWAEISYFSWWWDEQDETTRNNVRRLLRNKQLEFVTGGWVQPDEANSELYAMEIQLQEGHDWIRNNVGEEFIPKYGWAIDPFGYSPTMAWLLKKYGFRGMLIQRVHYAVKKELAKRKHLEFYWRQTFDKGREFDIFTHVMPFFSYDVPHTCGPDPSICCQFDFHRSPVGTGASCPWRKPTVAITAQNVAERAMLALDQYRKKAALYRSNTVLVPLGDDFRYQTKREADVQYINHQKIHDYINANVANVTIKFGTLSEYFDSVIGQFAPPVLKGSFFTYSDVNEDYWSGYFTSRVFDKALDRRLERVLFAADSLGGTKEELQQPRRALSLFQHHDGVTGTAKNHVVEDYAKRMHDAIRFTNDWLLQKFRKNYPQELAVVSDPKPCWISDSPRFLSENLCGDEGSVLVYNPLSSEQMCGDVTIPPRSLKVADLPCEVPGPIVGSKIEMKFDPATGLMIEPIREEWKVWKVTKGGAYLFQPGELMSYNLADVQIEENGFVVKTESWKRTVVEHKIPTALGGTAIAIDFIYEFFLDVDNEEWFVRFHEDIANDNVFYTDLNGFNFDTHYFRSDLPIQSQVFPMPTHAAIQDDVTRMTVLSEHAQGTASLEEGSIDVWLDRRLRQDDARGLGQGVQDNRPTRTRLRVVLERDGFDSKASEFTITSRTRRVWDQLQHPLEMFGVHISEQSRREARQRKENRLASRRRRGEKRNLNETNEDKGSWGMVGEELSKMWNYAAHFDLSHYLLGRDRVFTVENTKIPFVYMVYKRVDYLKLAIDSLRKSDFPKDRVPLIISHDGHVAEVVEYVESLKGEFQVIQLIHPHACYDHQFEFPGNDTTLNEGFRGDQYGNPRESWATCCKHHFTWIMRTVFQELDIQDDHAGSDEEAFDAEGLPLVDTFLFLEEDYIVAPTIYEAVISGLNLMAQHKDKVFFGLGLDPTEGGSNYEPPYMDGDSWYISAFRTGPMTMSRHMFHLLQHHASAYCRFDEYNWDWTIVYMMSQKFLPHRILYPSRSLSRHIGIQGGMHSDQAKLAIPAGIAIDTRFVGTKLASQTDATPVSHPRGFGGWGHPADQQHCMNVLVGDDYHASAT